MATLPTQTGAVTLLDMAKAMDPNGKIATTIELLAQSNEMLLDMPWLEGNLATGHQSNVRTGLPLVTWRKAYKGTPPSKSTRAKVVDTCGMLEARSEVDVKSFIGGDVGQFRMSEAMAFLEAMNQTLQTAVLYESETLNAERITGFAPRYSTLNPAVQSSQNVIDAGGTGSDNTSIYLVCWGENTVHGIYPKGSTAGLDHKDLGEIDAFDNEQNRFRAYADLWNWDCGLTVRDWRYVVRIANIDISDLLAQTGTQAETAATAIIKLMIKSMSRIPQMGMGKCAFYANRTVKEMLSVAAMNKSQNVLKVEEGINQFGTVAPGSVNNGTLKFLGVPIRTVDALLSTEARVVA